MNRGAFISGAGHLVLLVGLIVGDWLKDRMDFDTPPPEVTDVLIVSERDYAGLVLPQIRTPALPDIPDTLMQQSTDEPAPAPEPAERPAEVESPEPIASEDAEPTPEAPESPDGSDPLPSELVDDLSVDPVVPEPAPLVPEDILPRDEAPTPQEAPRIAPVPVPESLPSPEFAETPVPQVSPDSDSPDVALDLPAAAPEEATTEIVTEAETPSSAPAVSAIPRARPVRKATEESEPEPEPAPTPDSAPVEDPDSDPDPSPIDFGAAVKQALEAAVEDADQDTRPSPVARTTLSPSEIEGLRVAVQRCWNVGAVSTEALSVKVTVGISMSRDGKPGEPRLLGFSGGSEAAAGKAFDVARRAILRCGTGGYNLPSDRYEQWREIEITFNPEKMRLK